MLTKQNREHWYLCCTCQRDCSQAVAEGQAERPLLLRVRLPSRAWSRSSLAPGSTNKATAAFESSAFRDSVLCVTLRRRS